MEYTCETPTVITLETLIKLYDKTLNVFVLLNRCKLSRILNTYLHVQLCASDLIVLFWFGKTYLLLRSFALSLILELTFVQISLKYFTKKVISIANIYDRDKSICIIYIDYFPKKYYLHRKFTKLIIFNLHHGRWYVSVKITEK
jgi:hypothetical protein